MKYFEKLKTRPIVLYLLIGFVVMLILFTPLTNTMEALANFSKMQRELNALNSSAVELNRSAVEKGKQLLVEEDHTKKVFALVSRSCKSNGVVVKQVELPRQDVQSNVIVENHRITLEGKFASVLAALNQVAKELEPVKISSVIFKTEIINKEKVLVSQVTFQSVKLQKENE